MAAPLNTTLNGLNPCVRKSTYNGASNVHDTSELDGACPGTKDSDGNYRCCAMRDVCLGSGFCHSDIPISGGSGFYIMGCNDGSYNDNTACLSMCTTEALPDATWDDKQSLWKCCGTDSEGNVNCGSPTSYSFYASSPDTLLKTSSNDTNGDSTATPSIASPSASASAVSSSASAASATSTSSASNGLSGGAIAGAAIGGVIGGLAIAALVGFFFIRQRKRRRQTPTKMQDPSYRDEYGQDKPLDPQQQELPAYHVPPSELHTPAYDPSYAKPQRNQHSFNAELPG